MPRKKSFYQSAPTAPAKKVTKRPLVAGLQPSLAGAKPSIVPKVPGANTGFGGPQHVKPDKLTNVGSTPGIGVVRRLGTLKASGHPRAHRIGER